MSFDEVFDLTAEVYFIFYNNSICRRRHRHHGRANVILAYILLGIGVGRVPR